MKKVVIVMPAFNAEKNIENVITRIPHVYKEIIVVNDGSSDNTVNIVSQLGLTLISHRKNRGYGAAQKTGFRLALKKKTDIIVLLHSDGQYAPEEIEKLIKPLEKDEADVVLGSRVLGGKMLKGGMPLTRYLGNRLLTWIENLIFNASITEYHTGYRAYSGYALKKIPFHLNSDRFEFDSEIIIQSLRKGLRIKEVPILTHYGEESSSLNPFEYVPAILKITLLYLLHKIRLIKMAKYE